jgi:crossover junction endodeoxyribonuclease RusA
MSSKTPVTVHLPWPPSCNTYYRAVKGRVLLSARGRKYKDDVSIVLMAARVKAIPGRIRLDIDLHPPDRQKRDCDNSLKALVDSLKGHLFVDDSQVDEIHVYRREVRRPGVAVVTVSRIEEAEG